MEGQMQDAHANPLARPCGAVRSTRKLLLALVTVFVAVTSPAAAAPQLVGQWRFDEGAGQLALDDGPLGLHGELRSTAAGIGPQPLRIGGALGGGALR
ncbi:MAG: hypothetical protein ACRDMZ_05140, partial [Solirubrobacteraceae bacterium]